MASTKVFSDKIVNLSVPSEWLLLLTSVNLSVPSGGLNFWEQIILSEKNPDSVKHSIKREPKFCKCRLCHEYFYADTIDEARQACKAHAAEFHPDWGVTACYCPDF